MTESTTPSGNNAVASKHTPVRKIGRLERFLGPEKLPHPHRSAQDPAPSGIHPDALFIFIALFARISSASQGQRRSLHDPRDGYSSDPARVMSAWERTHRPCLLVKPIMHTDTWVHILGTSQGQYDIFYGIIWGRALLLKTG